MSASLAWKLGESFKGELEAVDEALIEGYKGWGDSKDITKRWARRLSSWEAEPERTRCEQTPWTVGSELTGGNRSWATLNEVESACTCGGRVDSEMEALHRLRRNDNLFSLPEKAITAPTRAEAQAGEQEGGVIASTSTSCRVPRSYLSLAAPNLSCVTEGSDAMGV
jgi:hypothetical protein